MKFEIIFEEDGTYWASIDIGKDWIFTVWNDFDDLVKNMKEATSLYLEGNKDKSRNLLKLAKFLKVEKELYAS